MIDWDNLCEGADAQDWAEAFGEGGGGSTQALPFSRNDVSRVARAHAKQGDYAEMDVQIIVQLKDGRWAFVGASCDTTGWGCQAGNHHEIANTLRELIPLIGDEARFIMDPLELLAET